MRQNTDLNFNCKIKENMKRKINLIIVVKNIIRHTERYNN